MGNATICMRGDLYVVEVRDWLSEGVGECYNIHEE